MLRSKIMEDAARYRDDVAAMIKQWKWARTSSGQEPLRLQTEAAYAVWIALTAYKALLDVIDDPDELAEYIAARTKDDAVGDDRADIPLAVEQHK